MIFFYKDNWPRQIYSDLGATGLKPTKELHLTVVSGFQLADELCNQREHFRPTSNGIIGLGEIIDPRFEWNNWLKVFRSLHYRWVHNYVHFHLVSCASVTERDDMRW